MIDNTDAQDITGRDHWLLCKALAYAIETIGRLPKRWQERSDRQDMIKLLDALSASPDYFRTGARSHIERRGVKLVAGRMEVADRDPAGVVRGVFPETPPETAS